MLKPLIAIAAVLLAAVSSEAAPRHYRQSVDRESRIVAHPAGCPMTLFCGCGVSVRVWGHPVRAFYQATAYGRLPRGSIASGNVAWRYRKGGGHAVYIEEALGGTLARVYDPNSGRHQTRVQVLNLAGWRIVDPRVVRVAAR